MTGGRINELKQWSGEFTQVEQQRGIDWTRDSETCRKLAKDLINASLQKDSRSEGLFGEIMAEMDIKLYYLEKSSKKKISGLRRARQRVLTTDTKSMILKGKNSKLDFKMKNYCSMKMWRGSKNKLQPGRRCLQATPEKRLLTRVYEELWKFNNKEGIQFKNG